MKVLLLSLALLVPALPVQADASFFHSVMESADAGEAESQFILGLAYRDGWTGNGRMGSTAVKWCELAVELGDPRPLFVIELLQKEKNQVVQDGAKAMQWLSRAAAR